MTKHSKKFAAIPNDKTVYDFVTNGPVKTRIFVGDVYAIYGFCSEKCGGQTV